MTRREAISVIIGTAPALALPGCAWLSGRSSYRFRMTVKVQTPQGMKSGSSVMKISEAKQVFTTSETHPISAELRGEAVVVDLHSGPIFVLLTIRDGGPLLFNEVTQALNPLSIPSPSPDDYIRQVRQLAAFSDDARTAELSQESWPTMVRFRDIHDPASVERVDPYEVGVERIALETTTASVTVGIENYLDWLPRQRGALVPWPNEPTPTPPFGCLTTAADFSTEIKYAS